MNREEIKHTPGPWWVEGGDPDAASWAARWPNIRADGYEVVGAQGLYGDYDTDMANARLIAAAPDLLRVAQLLIDANCPEAVAFVTQRARAAIAKANGNDTGTGKAQNQRGAG